MTFREFLQTKAETAGQYRERQAMREEWVTVVRRLFDQMRAWLAEADPDRVLDISASEVNKWERGLGDYQIPILKIGLAGTYISVVPVGRFGHGVVERPGEASLSVAGRVDIKGPFRHYILYRTVKDGQEVWYALDEQFVASLLDRGRFERILQDLLA